MWEFLFNSKIFCFKKKFFEDQDKTYLPIKADISTNLQEIRKKLKDLLVLNQSREDLAKLKEHEFYLDLEEFDKLQKECDSEILKVCLRIYYWIHVES